MLDSQELHIIKTLSNTIKITTKIFNLPKFIQAGILNLSELGSFFVDWVAVSGLIGFVSWGKRLWWERGVMPRCYLEEVNTIKLTECRHYIHYIHSALRYWIHQPEAIREWRIRSIVIKYRVTWCSCLSWAADETRGSEARPDVNIK